MEVLSILHPQLLGWIHKTNATTRLNKHGNARKMQPWRHAYEKIYLDAVLKSSCLGMFCTSFFVNIDCGGHGSR